MEHLLSVRNAFDHPVTIWSLLIVTACLVLAPIVMSGLQRAGLMSDSTALDAWRRYRTWLWFAPAVMVPLLLCPLSAIILVAVFSLLCYREFARATGLFRERRLSAIVVIAILGLAFASVDHWYNFFTAIPPLAIVLIFGVAAIADRPKGYLQRTSLATVGLLLFGAGLAHLGYIANAENYRPILCMLLLCSQLSDVLGFIAGKSLGRRHLFPNTSPSKTVAGHLGSLLGVIPLAAFLGHAVYPGGNMDQWPLLLGLGLIIAVGAQLGDLVLSSIKRDLGLKDLAVSLPGHGGFTDRFNSLLLVAPAAFHYLGYFEGFGLERATRVITGHE
jgi:phosphatidate cytidylyltransferase